MAGYGGSYPCSHGCTCRRHGEHPSRNRREAALKGWSDERRGFQSARQRATELTFEGIDIVTEKGYHAAHGNVEKYQGKASGYRCIECSMPAYCWAFNHKNIINIEHVRRDPTLGFYSKNPNDYMPMCASCHRKFDNV